MWDCKISFLCLYPSKTFSGSSGNLKKLFFTTAFQSFSVKGSLNDLPDRIHTKSMFLYTLSLFIIPSKLPNKF